MNMLFEDIPDYSFNPFQQVLTHADKMKILIVLCYTRKEEAMKIVKNNLSFCNNHCWQNISRNPYAIDILEQNPDKIDWTWLSSNPAAIHLLEQNPDKIDWRVLSQNPNAISLLGTQHRKR